MNQHATPRITTATATRSATPPNTSNKFWPDRAAAAALHPAIEVDGTSWSFREDVIDYPHIPMQVVLQPAQVRAVAARAAPGKEMFPGIGIALDPAGAPAVRLLAHPATQPPEVDDDDTTILMYTSGTTALPKAVLLTYNDFTAGVGYNAGGFRVDVGFEYLKGKDRNIVPAKGVSMPGLYKMTILVPLVAVSYGW